MRNNERIYEMRDDISEISSSATMVKYNKIFNKVN